MVSIYDFSARFTACTEASTRRTRFFLNLKALGTAGNKDLKLNKVHARAGKCARPCCMLHPWQPVHLTHSQTMLGHIDCCSNLLAHC